MSKSAELWDDLLASRLEGPGLEEVVRAARTLNPDFPGVFDLSLWRIGRTVCRPANPRCGNCQPPWDTSGRVITEQVVPPAGVG